MALHFALLDARLHQRSSFASGVGTLDSYLQQRANQHQQGGIATTHVLADSEAPARILGYCTLSAAQLTLSELQEADRRRLPAYPVPAVRVGRLAVAATEQGKGYGQLLLGHAVNLALSLRQTLGVRVLVVDAKDTAAALFYQRYGFTPTAENALTLYLPLGRA